MIDFAHKEVIELKKRFSNFVFELILGAGVIMLTSYLFSGVYVKDFSVAFLVAIVLTLLNKFIKPILKLLALPLTFMTFGLFGLVINGLILLMATNILAPDFQIESFGLCIVTSIIVSILYSVLGISK